MTEAEIFKAIMREAIDYRGNFLNIDTLIKLEQDYHAARTATYEDFSGCPASYSVLKDADMLCEDNEDEYDCVQCWRNAVNEKINGVI